MSFPDVDILSSSGSVESDLDHFITVWCPISKPRAANGIDEALVLETGVFIVNTPIYRLT